ncbi:uncharacterized protein LOC134290643 [Aedes albopictus]|uniref:DNA/RNA non-specific endonuclease/pyrophosphatase/phosphodiesterase domain-containing protein n=1 Tax=Aedes albopictus TaxID=7160 RepID=A0ABM1Y203_AEDAL
MLYSQYNGDQLILHPRNGINGKNRVSAVIECVLGYSFRYVHDFRPLLITEVSCDFRVTGNVRTSRVPDQCPGSYNAVGFYVPFSIYGHRFFDLYYICFDETNATPIYTHHTVYGNEIQYRCTTSFRPVFKVPGFPKNLDVTSAYSQYNQENRLTALFASDSKPRESAMEYFDENYLQKGHLTPHADGLFTTWQWSSYFYINVVGMWERINNGNWKFLEEKVRTIANATKQNLDIYTGAYDTLSLCSLQHYCNKFTLSNGRIPVPKWLWKIVKSPENNAAIALVVSNNPFVDELPICGQGHESYGWNKNIVTGRTHGAVSYCSVQDLKRIVRNIPREALAPYILKVVYSNG